jgi:hypothetical protein
VRDAGAYCALHDDGRRIMLAAYTHTVLEFVVGKPPADPTRHEVHLSGVLITEDLGGIAVLDYKQHFDTLSTRAIQVGPIGVVAIDRRLAQEMGAMREPLRHFATVEELEAALRERGDRMYGRLVERRVFRRVPEQEEQEVLARFGLKAGD